MKAKLLSALRLGRLSSHFSYCSLSKVQPPVCRARRRVAALRFSPPLAPRAFQCRTLCQSSSGDSDAVDVVSAEKEDPEIRLELDELGL